MLAHPEGKRAIFFVNQVSYHTDLETVHRKVHIFFFNFLRSTKSTRAVELVKVKKQEN